MSKVIVMFITLITKPQDSVLGLSRGRLFDAHIFTLRKKSRFIHIHQCVLYCNFSYCASTSKCCLLPWLWILFLLTNFINTHKTCLSKIKSATSLSNHWPYSCSVCQNIQVQSSLNSPSPNCSRFRFFKSQCHKDFFLHLQWEGRFWCLYSIM